MMRVLRSVRQGEWFSIVLACAAFGVLYAGFYFPDPYVLSNGMFGGIILNVIRCAAPLLFLGAVVLALLVRRRTIAPGSVLLLCASTLLGGFVCYEIGDASYQRWFDAHRREYHPYLQLVPPSYVPKGDARPVRIFCLGGSTTEFSDAGGRDWPSRVEGILRTEYAMEHAEVSNLGRQWFTSLHTLINYETNLRPRRPSAIVLMQSINDLLQNADFSYFSHGAFREDYGHFYGPVNRIINRRSLWRYLSDAVAGLWYASPRTIVTTDRFPGIASYVRNIRTIVELARRDSAVVILMTEPCLVKPSMTREESAAVRMLAVEAINDSIVWSPETVMNGMEQYNDALRKIAREEHLALIDLAALVPKTLVYFRDEVHYRDTTFALIAPIIARGIHEALDAPGSGR